MGKPTESVLGGNEKQNLGNGRMSRFSRPGTRSPQKGLHFGERFFKRREIGRVRRQEQEATAFGFESLFHTRSLMDAQMIQDHELSGAQAGSKQLFHVDLKSGSISRSIQEESFSHPLCRVLRDQRHHRSIVARNLAESSLPSGSIGIKRSHRNMRAGLIDEHQILAEQLLHLLTAMPCSAWNRQQCSSRVASGWASHCALKWACNTAPFLAGRAFDPFWQHVTGFSSLSKIAFDGGY